MGKRPTRGDVQRGAGVGKKDAMTLAIAQSPVVTGASLVNAACRKYQEALDKLKRVEADWQTLPTQEAVTLVLETQGILREARQLLDQGTSQMTGMNSPEWGEATSQNTRDKVAECLQKAYDLGNSADRLLAVSDHLIQACLADQEAYERYQTAKALCIVVAGAILTIGVALYFLLR
jgi:hypothetical protein